MMRESASARGLSREGFIELYIDNQRIFIIIYLPSLIFSKQQHVLDTNAGKQLS